MDNNAAFLTSKRDQKVISKFLKEKFPNGSMKPEQVVDLARPKSSLIHKYFQWDDTKAAELYRISQARKLISCLVVEIGGEEIREFHSIYLDGNKNRSYVSLERTMAKESLFSQVVDQALERAVYWKEQYKHLKELSPIVEAVTDLERQRKHGKKNSKTKVSRSRKENPNTSNRVQAG